jgi:L-cysteine:1D-myo-inositol 2-amino-2-deoxy-alpha-D-glucopyranoside ligase
VKLGGIKMSKSLGNLRYVSDLVREGVEPMVIRLAVVQYHYRDGWEYSDDLLVAAALRLKAWRAAGIGSGGLDEVRAHLDNDLDTPAAVIAIDAAAARGEGISEAAMLLGIAL